MTIDISENINIAHVNTKIAELLMDNELGNNVIMVVLSAVNNIENVNNVQLDDETIEVLNNLVEGTEIEERFKNDVDGIYAKRVIASVVENKALDYKSDYDAYVAYKRNDTRDEEKIIEEILNMWNPVQNAYREMKEKRENERINDSTVALKVRAIKAKNLDSRKNIKSMTLVSRNKVTVKQTYFKNVMKVKTTVVNKYGARIKRTLDMNTFTITSRGYVKNAITKHNVTVNKYSLVA